MSKLTEIHVRSFNLATGTCKLNCLPGRFLFPHIASFIFQILLAHLSFWKCTAFTRKHPRLIWWQNYVIIWWIVEWMYWGFVREGEECHADNYRFNHVLFFMVSVIPALPTRICPLGKGSLHTLRTPNPENSPLFYRSRMSEGGLLHLVRKKK